MDSMEIDSSLGGTKRKARKTLPHASKKPRIGDYIESASTFDGENYMNEEPDFSDMIGEHLTGEELKKKLKRELVDKDFYNDFDDLFDDDDLD